VRILDGVAGYRFVTVPELVVAAYVMWRIAGVRGRP
jgi:hypothetical protein